MGFPFSRPTTFEDPMFRVGEAWYYAVDHTSSYLWNTTSWEISLSVLPYLPIIVRGPQAWEREETLKRAIHIDQGKIINPRILAFQNRSELYPHDILKQTTL